jgi:hypothetical protein
MAFRIALGSTSARFPEYRVGNSERTVFPTIRPDFSRPIFTDDDPTSIASTVALNTAALPD